MHQRLKQWFHNNTRESLGNKDAVIPVKKTMKVPALWQAYSTLYYQSKLKPLVESAWTSYVKGVKEESASHVGDEVEGGAGKQKKTKSRIKIQNEVVQAKFKTETEEVKAEVEAYVKGLKKKKKQSPEQEGNDVLIERYQRLVQIHLSQSQTYSPLDYDLQWHRQDTTNGRCVCESHP